MGSRLLIGVAGCRVSGVRRACNEVKWHEEQKMRPPDDAGGRIIKHRRNHGQSTIYSNRNR